jgi:molybdenum-dependent DNA-binding transcriptional regulator ModE
MRFTHRQLRAFAAVADTGSFSAAAPKLHLTTSAVSLLVRELESVVGFRLFERTSRRVALTPHGTEFLPAARRVLNELQQAVIFALDMLHRVSAHVTIAAPPAIAAAGTTLHAEHGRRQRDYRARHGRLRTGRGTVPSICGADGARVDAGQPAAGRAVGRARYRDLPNPPAASSGRPHCVSRPSCARH